LLLLIAGLAGIVVAWEFLLLANRHTITVIVLVMGGVLFCLICYFLWRTVRRQEAAQVLQELAAGPAE
jgi:4-amino-4-deoxy-L-arabinose transferase-like glycosyltransferase